MQAVPTDNTAQDLTDKTLDVVLGHTDTEGEILPKVPIANSPVDTATPKSVRASVVRLVQCLELFFHCPRSHIARIRAHTHVRRRRHRRKIRQ